MDTEAIGNFKWGQPVTNYPTQLDRIEAKLDTLIAALAEEGDEEQPAHTLDGEPAGGERDQSQSL